MAPKSKSTKHVSHSRRDERPRRTSHHAQPSSSRTSSSSRRAVTTYERHPKAPRQDRDDRRSSSASSYAGRLAVALDKVKPPKLGGTAVVSTLPATHKYYLKAKVDRALQHSDMSKKDQEALKDKVSNATKAEWLRAMNVRVPTGIRYGGDESGQPHCAGEVCVNPRGGTIRCDTRRTAGGTIRRDTRRTAGDTIRCDTRRTAVNERSGKSVRHRDADRGKKRGDKK